jgi:8-oxo-dGTP pyrophosphatase MutT (NUDIX family)
MHFSHFKDLLQEVLSGELPGTEAQFAMARNFRPHVEAIPEGVRPAGVLALIHPYHGRWTITYIKRHSGQKKDSHRGQISFPGGKIEKSDKDLSETAVRETEEEIGVSRAEIELMGALTELYIPVSNYLVQPFVGLSENDALSFSAQPDEVDDIVHVKVSTLLNPSNLKAKNIRTNSGLLLRNVPYFDLGM